MDDGDALVFQTAILTEGFSILGAPRLTLRLASDRSCGQVAVRLGDVAPDGRVTRVSYQVLNLAQRHSHEHPAPMTPGAFESITITLGACGHHFAPGHRLRLSVATGYWPTVWPAPERATLTLEMPGCTLTLPYLDASAPGVTFAAPERGLPTPMTQTNPGLVRRITTQDHVTGERIYMTQGVGGLFGEGVLRFDALGTEISHDLTRTLVIRDDDPLSARATIEQRYTMGRPGWEIEIRSQLEMRGDATHFHLSGWLTAAENGTIAARREWSERIAREAGT